jgi:hypothetical protein
MDACPKARTQHARRGGDECRLQAPAQRLAPRDIEAIAQRVRELVREDLLPARYVDAAALARQLSVDRDWVYAHATELGAIRLGGPCGRLRFDLQRVIRLLAEDPSDAPPQQPKAARRMTRRGPGTAVELLPYDRS